MYLKSSIVFIVLHDTFEIARHGLEEIVHIVLCLDGIAQAIVREQDAKHRTMYRVLTEMLSSMRFGPMKIRSCSAWFSWQQRSLRCIAHRTLPRSYVPRSSILESERPTDVRSLAQGSIAIELQLTFEIGQCSHGTAGRNSSVHEMWVLQSEPSRQRTWIRSTKGNPSGLIGDLISLIEELAECCQISQSLCARQILEILHAEVSARKHVQSCRKCDRLRYSVGWLLP